MPYYALGVVRRVVFLECRKEVDGYSYAEFKKVRKGRNKMWDVE